MKVKELQKTVNVAWSPQPQNPIYLAAGTAAQQLDTSATSALEIYSTNFQDPGYDLELKASQPSPYKFQKLVWSPTGYGGTHPNGLLVGGCEGGHLTLYSAAKLLAGEESLIAHQNKHTGSIRGLDFNPFQHNLLASVASDSEIFIWDLNNTTTPMAPGTKSTPLEDIQNVAWNRQVQHILASVFSSRCVIWDLRKNEQIIKLSDSQSRVRWSALQWHPDIATQLWLASEDDQSPVVQLWDLRYATTPAKTLQIHQRGILGLNWCPLDTDMMVSCGKDNKIYCWNPNTEQSEPDILSEVATTMQWYSDVQWCPRNPALIAGSSLEGNVSIYSLFGGTQQQVQTSNKIADSFPGMDQFASAPIPQQTTQTVYLDLKRAPKWMKKPAGVSFAFGGRLVSFNKNAPNSVSISQVITEHELVERANSLEKTLEEGNYTEYCRQKADEMNDQQGRFLWYFLKANFEMNPREEMLNLLGYNKEDVTNKFNKYIKEDAEIEQVTGRMGTLTHSDSSESDESTDLSGGDNNALFDAIATENKALSEQSEKADIKYKIPTGEDSDGLIAEAILSGNIEAAVELCIEVNKPTEALIIASTAGIDLLTKVQNQYLKKQENELSNIISALVTRDWLQLASECTIDSWKQALVAALTHSDGQMYELCVKLGERLQEGGLSHTRNALLCYVCAGDLEKLVETWLQLKQSERSEGSFELNTTELQELVEIVMLLKKSLELRGNVIEPSGKLADFLSQYAGLLAAQGALDTALAYLGPTEDPDLEDLRERLYYALGHKQQQQHYPQSRSQPQHQQQQQQNNYNAAPPAARFNQSRGSFSSGTVAPPQNPMLNQFSNPPQAAPWNQSQPAATIPPVSMFNPMQPQQQTPVMPPQATPAKPPLLPPTDTINQPSRPASAGLQNNASHTRSKYLLDPSVTSGPQYGQTMGGYNPAPMPQNNFNASPFNQPQFNQMPPTSAPYQPSVMQPAPAPVPAPAFQPFQPGMPSSVSNLGNPASYLAGVPPIETVPNPMPQSGNRNPTPPPGWNDPPALMTMRQKVFYNERHEMSAKHAGTRKWQKIINSNTSNDNKHSTSSSQGNFMFQKKSVSGAPQPAAPITHPLFGVDPNSNPQNGYLNPNAQYQNQSVQSSLPPTQASQQQIPYNPSQQNNNQFPNQMNFQTSAVSHGYNPQAYNETATAAAPPPVRQAEIPKEKPPLPEEFIYLQTVLEELKVQCLNIAPDPRTKRKFADVGKRLDSLYDALTERRLSPNTLSALNQIVQCLQIGDYGNALATHTMIVSGPDFSQTASFMPGIKVLVQSASDLKVYLR